jgi:IclR family acetate operon transcriptional repressor
MPTSRINASAPSGKKRPPILNAMYLLKAFADDEDQMAIAELAQLLEISPSAASRLVHTLAEAGMLEQVPVTGKYRLGPATIALRSLATRSFHKRQGESERRLAPVILHPRAS